MAKAKEKKITGYTIEVKTNPEFCGIGAGGVQFAYGKAVVAGGTIVNWYREHEGYEVTEIVEEPETETPET